MQSRTNSTSARTVLMVCLVIILIVGVLYFMKRVEANRLTAELDLTKVRWPVITDFLLRRPFT